jgi:serine/threonine protein kinase
MEKVPTDAIQCAKTVAIKRFRPRTRRQVESVASAFHRERLNLLSIKQVRVVSVLATFEVKAPRLGHFDLILPYADGGDLDGFLHANRSPAWLQKRRERGPDSDENGGFCVFKMDRGERVCIYRNMVALLDALAFLHHGSKEMFVIHRDIKPHNILIFGEYFKISDFGHSRLKDFDETSKTEWLAGQFPSVWNNAI